MAHSIVLRALAPLLLGHVMTLPGPAAPEEQAAVAVVAALDGEATVATAPGAANEPLRLFDWLRAGSRVEVLPGGRLSLAFANGSRFELREEAKANLSRTGLEAISGEVRTLEPVPPMPEVAAIAAHAEGGARSGAVRVRRGGKIRDLYPRSGTSAIAESTTLRFEPVEGATYRVEVEDRTGRAVFEAETRSAAITVPLGVLEPGARYYWKVRTVEMTGASVRGEAEFATLSAEDVERRTALRAALGAGDEAASLALLAAIDQRLGLMVEARDGFRRALETSPDSESYARALQEVERELLFRPGASPR